MRGDPLKDERQVATEIRGVLRDVDSPFLGPKTAPVTLVVFSDFQCPFCKRLATSLKELFPDFDNSVRVVYKYFPLASHGWARQAAEAAACTAVQDPESFWKVHDYFFGFQQRLNAFGFRQDFLAFARTLPRIDEARLESCIINHETAPTVDRDVAIAQQLEIRAAPVFFINGARVQGYRPTQDLRNLIDEALAETANDVNLAKANASLP